MCQTADALQVSPERFRPNLVFSGSLQPYAEDSWQDLRIGGAPFSVTGAPCIASLISHLQVLTYC